MQFPDTINTPRLVLRPFHQGHPEAHHNLVMVSKEELGRFFPWAQKHQSVDDSIAAANHFHEAWQQGKAFTYAIYLGDIFIGAIDWRVKKPWWGDIGYWMGTPYTGKGYMTEAVMALTEQAFQSGVHRAVIRCRPSNIASAKVARKAGYQYEGHLRDDTLEDDGTFTDSHLFSCLATDPTPQA